MEAGSAGSAGSGGAGPEDLPFDMPKLRRRLRASAAASSESSSASQSSEPQDPDVEQLLQGLPFDMPKLRKKQLSRSSESSSTSHSDPSVSTGERLDLHLASFLYPVAGLLTNSLSILPRSWVVGRFRSTGVVAEPGRAHRGWMLRRLGPLWRLQQSGHGVRPRAGWPRGRGGDLGGLGLGDLRQRHGQCLCPDACLWHGPSEPTRSRRTARAEP